MLATKIRYTFADLLEQDPSDETIYDILGGELVVFSSPNSAHAVTVMELALYLGEAQRAGLGQAATAPFAVAFDYAERGTAAQDVTHPDLLFIVEERRAIIGRQCVEAAPDIIVEVLSPTTRTLDLPGGPKFDIYERYGVTYYWIVDLDARTIAQYTWENGRYSPPVVLRPGDMLTCPRFPGLTRPVAHLFAAVA
jgi:Uma2 family endonuclease